jgi:excisionase family DNA binding protein
VSAPGEEPRDGDEPRNEDDELLTPAEVAKMFRVDPKTVTRWHQAGKISAIRTLGGHRRFYASEVRRLLGEDGPRPSE